MKAFVSIFAQQIASNTIDTPYSGFLVNQSIDDEYTVLQYETERTTVDVGTYSLSTPSGLSSNKHSILFLSADKDCSISITTRDYGDTTDNIFIAFVGADEPLLMTVHNIKSCSITTTTATSFQSFVAKISNASATATTSPNQGIDPGSLPVGGLVWISGVFSSPGTGYSEAGILPLPSYLQFCDGSLVTDSESIFYGKNLPDLTSDITLIGSSTAGTTSSSSTSATLLTGFGSDWNIYQSIPVNSIYKTKIYMRIK